MTDPTRACLYCGANISAMNSRALYCSRAHMKRACARRHAERNPGYGKRYSGSPSRVAYKAALREARPKTNCAACQLPMVDRRGQQTMHDECRVVGSQRRCRKCLQLKDPSEFGRLRGSIETACAACKAAHQLEWMRKKHGLPLDATADDLRARWRAGRFLHKRSGYIYVLDRTHHRANRDGYVLEHILVAEEKFGIRITRDYTVHHLNANRADNRPQNLDLRLGPHGVGGDVMHVLLSRPEFRVQARAILSQYESEVAS